MMFLKILRFPMALAILTLPLSSLAQKIMPTSTGTGAGARYTFTMGPLTLQSGPKNCGRIFAVNYNTTNILHMDTSSATTYGSTFWPSPQLGWVSDWPPTANIDGTTADTATVTSDTSLLLKGVTDATNKVRINKKYWANTADSSFNYHYTLVNTGTVAKSWGPWEDTRIDTGGFYLFPKGTDTITGALAPYTTVVNGVVWYHHNTASVLGSGTNKFYSDGAEGWYAHVTAAHMLLIKSFKDTPASQKAPSPEDEIEFYATNSPLTASSFIEMEAQGPYTSIAAGDSLQWDMKWIVRKLPDTMSIVEGNPSIVAYIRSLVASQVTAIHGFPSSSNFPTAQLDYSNGNVSLNLQRTSNISISLFNSRGQVVSRVHSGLLAEGNYNFPLDANVPKGIYWLVLKNNDAAGVLKTQMVVRF